MSKIGWPALSMMLLPWNQPVCLSFMLKPGFCNLPSHKISEVLQVAQPTFFLTHPCFQQPFNIAHPPSLCVFSGISDGIVAFVDFDIISGKETIIFGCSWKAAVDELHELKKIPYDMICTLFSSIKLVL